MSHHAAGTFRRVRFRNFAAQIMCALCIVFIAACGSKGAEPEPIPTFAELRDQAFEGEISELTLALPLMRR